MGSEFNSRIYKGTEKVVAELWENDVQQALLEYGHRGYTGSIAEKAGDEIIFKNTIYNNIDEAEAWLVDNADKWGSALAVQAYSIVKSNKALEKFEQKRKVELDKLSLIENKKIMALKSGASANVSCKNCGSKIARKFIKNSTNCPICNYSFYTKAESERINKIDKKIAKINEDQLSASRGELVWVIGAWCSD